MNELGRGTYFRLSAIYLWFLLHADAYKADNVGMFKICHKLGLPDKVLNSLQYRPRLQGFYRHEGRHTADITGELALIHLSKGAFAQLLQESEDIKGR